MNLKATMRGKLSDTGEEFDLPEMFTPAIVFKNGRYYKHTIENLYVPTTFFCIEEQMFYNEKGELVEWYYWKLGSCQIDER